jgi:hypothetical protein
LVEKDGFAGYERILNFGKGFLKLEKESHTVHIPILPVPEDPYTVYAVLSWDGPGVEGIEMIARNGQEQLVDLKQEAITPNLLMG